MEKIPVSIGVVDGGLGINFGRRHGLEGAEFKEFLYTLLQQGGFRLPETVRYDRNKASTDGKAYVDWMRLRISSDECQVSSVNPFDAMLKMKTYLSSRECEERWDLQFEVA